MAEKLPYDIDVLIEAFNLQSQEQCMELQMWMQASFSLNEMENSIIHDLHQDMAKRGDYLNEEELKIRFVGMIFFLAKIEVENTIRVFYERSLNAEVNGYPLAVIADCLVAEPFGYNTPKNPYFFLQEFKKGKGEKNDPEAQMLMAMLIAQSKNNDEKPLYGGFLVGTDWRFAILIGKNYCTSQKFDMMKKQDVIQMVFVIRKLKDFILAR